MKENKLLHGFQESLQEILLSFSEGEMSEEEVLKTLNEVIHYTTTFTPFIYESFYIEALKINKVPKVLTFLLSLFTLVCSEDALIQEFYDSGTRIKVLERLGLEKTLLKYREFLINQDVETQNWFRGDDLKIYYTALENETTLKDVRDTLLEELKEQEK